MVVIVNRNTARDLWKNDPDARELTHSRENSLIFYSCISSRQANDDLPEVRSGYRALGWAHRTLTLGSADIPGRRRCLGS